MDERVALSSPYKVVKNVIVARKDVNLDELSPDAIISPGVASKDSLQDMFFSEMDNESSTNEHLIPLHFEGEDNESEELIMELVSLGKYEAAYIRSDYAELGVQTIKT